MTPGLKRTPPASRKPSQSSTGGARRHAAPLSTVSAELTRIAGEVGGESRDVSQRLKRFDTIVNKLGRLPRMQLTQTEDVGGARAVVAGQRTADAVVDAVQRLARWKVRRLREYIDGRQPGAKPDGYRAVHVVVEVDGCYVEIQVRTRGQDAWAQSVERATRRLGEGLKFGTGPDDLRKYFWLAAELDAAEELGKPIDPKLPAELVRLAEATKHYREFD